MKMPIEVLEAEVLSLPRVQRSHLLERLLASLDPDTGWEQDWAFEAGRREARIVAGESSWLPGEDVVARLHQAIEHARDSDARQSPAPQK